MRRPQLNSLKPRQSTVLDQGRDIPILGKIVGDSAELKTTKPEGWIFWIVSMVRYLST